MLDIYENFKNRKNRGVLTLRGERKGFEAANLVTQYTWILTTNKKPASYSSFPKLNVLDDWLTSALMVYNPNSELK